MGDCRACESWCCASDRPSSPVTTFVPLTLASPVNANQIPGIQACEGPPVVRVLGRATERREYGMTKAQISDLESGTRGSKTMATPKAYCFEVKRKGRRTYVEAGYKVGGKKVPLVVIPVSQTGPQEVAARPGCPTRRPGRGRRATRSPLRSQAMAGRPRLQDRPRSTPSQCTPGERPARE